MNRFALRRNGTDWIGRGEFTKFATGAFIYSDDKHATESAVYLAWENRPTMYEVIDMDTHECIARIQFRKSK